MKKILVVGAGFTGATIARTLADTGEYLVTVIDRRSHVAGNAFDFMLDGTNVHEYGPHIFHTNNEKVVEFLSRFTDWIPYEHRVLALLADGNHVPFPPNEETLKTVKREDLIETFYRPYTEKMWDMLLEKVSPKVLERVPIRDDREDRYFPNDYFQAMPSEGYTEMFRWMLDHENISTHLDTPFLQTMEISYDHVFYTGAIDEYYNHVLGRLPYRTLFFELYAAQEHQPATTVNFTTKDGATRKTEWRGLPGPHKEGGTNWVTYEYSIESTGQDPFYPVPDVDGKNRELYKKYADIVNPRITFCGRLGNYAYLNMDQAVSSALAVARQYIG